MVTLTDGQRAEALRLANRRGVPAPMANEILNRMVLSANAGYTTTLAGRQDLADRAGYAFGQRRDYYKTLGWKRQLDFEDYHGKYRRQGVAQRIVDAPANDTWASEPAILDGRDEEARDDTPFVQAFRELADKIRLWHYLERVDRLSGIGQFGVLLIGVRDGGELADEVSGEFSASDILYLQPFHEGAIEIRRFNGDPQSERFALPETYSIEMAAATADPDGEPVQARTEIPTQKREVHASRVIHVAEGLEMDDIYGRPRLRPVYNDLDDLLKVSGGSAEAFWRLVYKGMVVSTKEGYEMPSDADEVAELEEKVYAYAHDLLRFLTLEGMEVQELGGQTVDPTGMFGVIVDQISAVTRIPKRILLGSERGELASSQDSVSWSTYIQTRRTKFAEPQILRPLIDRFIKWKIVPEPETDTYSARWEPLFKLNQLESGELAESMARAFSAVTGGLPQEIVTAEEFRQHYTTLPAQRPDDGRIEEVRDEDRRARDGDEPADGDEPVEDPDSDEPDESSPEQE